MSAALIVIDMLNPYDHPDAEPLMDSVRGMIGELQGLMAAARDDGLQMIYVNDHHGDFTAGPNEIAQRALRGEAPELIEPVLPPEDVPFIIKARHSIFYQTLLEYFLREEEVDRLVFAGQVTEQCILYSALDGYLRHFEVVVAKNAVACISPKLSEAAIEMMETNMHAQIAENVDAVFAACRG